MKSNLLHFKLLCLFSAVSAFSSDAEVVTKNAGFSNAYGEEVARGKLVESESAKDGVAWKIEVLKREENLVRLVLSYRYPDAIKKGDLVTYRAMARSLDPGRNATFELRVQDSADGYSTVAIAKDGAGTDFRQIGMQFRAEKDYAPEQLTMNIWPGFQVQNVLIENISVKRESSDGQGGGERPEARTFSFSGDEPLKGVTPDSDLVVESFAGGRGAEPDGALRLKLPGKGVGFEIPDILLTRHYHMRVHGVAKGGAAVPLSVEVLKGEGPALWSGQLEFNAEWRDLSRLIPPLDVGEPARLRFAAKAPGEVELDEIRIEYLTSGELGLDPIEKKGNLLSHSSFPFGVPELWNGSSQYYQTESIETDPGVIGPSGATSLRLRSGDSHFQFNTAFQGEPGKKHTVSLWARTNKPGYFGVRIGPPSEKIYEKPWAGGVHVTTEWQRFSHTVELPFTSEGFYQLQLDLSRNSVVWIDGVMVEVADELSDFQRADPIELTLRPKGDYPPFALYHPGQPLSVALHGLGDVPEGAKLTATVGSFNSSERIELPAIPLEKGPFQTVTIHCDREQLKPLGSYRVEFLVVDAEGNALSRKADTLLHRMRRPKASGRLALDSPFGVHIPTRVEYSRAVKAMGANWVRNFHLGWGRHVKGDKNGWEWDWSKADRNVKAAAQARLAMLGILGHPPRWVNKAGDYRGYRAVMFAPTDENLDKWADYAGAIAGRYKNEIQAWETWNEPFWTRFFIDHVNADGEFVHASPQKLFDMTRVSTDAIRKVHPEAQIIWNMGGENHPEFDNEFAALNPWPYLDGVAYHSYASDLGGFPGDLFEQHARAVRPILENNGAPPMEVWNSEGGPGGGHFHFMSPLGPAPDMSPLEDRTSSYIARSYCTMMANGVTKFFIYAHYFGHWRPDYLLLQPDGRFAPNAVAYSNMAWHLEGKRFVERVEVGEGLSLFLFEDDSAAAGFLAINSANGWQAGKLSESVDTTDLYGNPVDTRSAILMDCWFLSEGKKASELKAILIPPVERSVASRN